MKRKNKSLRLSLEETVISRDLMSPAVRLSRLTSTRPLHFTDAELSPRRYNRTIDSPENRVLVFLHVQKTGGSTFGNHLVHDLRVEPACECRLHRKRCSCLNDAGRVWLFSRFSTGWKCGLHADWTELHACVDDQLNEKEGKLQRTYLYITMLREPMSRFLSEFIQVSKRGKEWSEATLRCNGVSPSRKQLPLCYTGTTWKGVSLDDFISCDYNLAINRQTRMLADLTDVNCYNVSSMKPSERTAKLLQTAKQNLVGMAFFGLVEMQLESQYLFERTFNLKFSKDFDQFERTKATRVRVNASQNVRLQERIRLDDIVYAYAKALFEQRLKRALSEDGLSSLL